jgi:hypothetical protein
MGRSWSKAQQPVFLDESVAGVNGLHDVDGIDLDGLTLIRTETFFHVFGDVHQINTTKEDAGAPTIEDDYSSVFPRSADARESRFGNKNCSQSNKHR